MSNTKKIIKNEAEMMIFGEEMAKKLILPAVIELIGDVGAGKTTFTRGLAKGLGVAEAVTSPSFTISKKYFFSGGSLTHYDFYRLDEPGLMAEDLMAAMNKNNSLVVVEWGSDVEGILPKDRIVIRINYTEAGERELEVEK